MNKKGRGILVVHNDLSARVARYLVPTISAKGHAVTRRNIRYGYFPTMYELVLLLGVEIDSEEGSIIAYEYVPYPVYCAEATGTHLSVDAYHAMYADKLLGKILEALEQF